MPSIHSVPLPSASGWGRYLPSNEMWGPVSRQHMSVQIRCKVVPKLVACMQGVGTSPPPLNALHGYPWYISELGRFTRGIGRTHTRRCAAEEQQPIRAMPTSCCVAVDAAAAAAAAAATATVRMRPVSFWGVQRWTWTYRRGKYDLNSEALAFEIICTCI
jgi:hypothetical protein